MINVTKTYLPDQILYNEFLERVWKNHWLTNHGPLENELCNALRNYLDVDNIILTNNGTSPLQMAMKFLLSEPGEIITTPFSYIATASSIVWEGFKPVFVDIDPEYLTINECLIEDAITTQTKAILATHVFGNACNVEVIEKIANKHCLKVIYDAAHCFGVKYNGKSLFAYGDISTCSFHATKIYHTAEGGALFFRNGDWRKKLVSLGNFGHDGKYDFEGVGINSKMSELHAAMGLAVLPDMSEIFARRSLLVSVYRNLIDWDMPIKEMKLRTGVSWNYSYYPIIFDNVVDLENTISSLSKLEIYPRRYFYPSLNTVDYLKGQSMPVSESIAGRILCLPLYHDLEECTIAKIADVISNVLNPVLSKI